jgi:hypothetical protein
MAALVVLVNASSAMTLAASPLPVVGLPANAASPFWLMAVML